MVGRIYRIGPPDPRLERIMTLLGELAQGNLDARAAPSDAGDELDAIILGVNMLAEEFAARHIGEVHAEARLEELLGVVIGLSSLDFSGRARQNDAGDVFDGLAAGLNMLGEELQATTVGKSYLESIFDSMSDGTVVLNTDRTIRSVNRTACELFGRTEDELIGRPVVAFMADDPATIRSTIDGILQDGKLRHLDRTVRAKDGTLIPVRIGSQAVQAADGHAMGIVAVLHDMREIRSLLEAAEAARKESERALQELRTTQAQLLHSGKLAVVGELAGGVAHEINNPMVAVLGLSEMCLELLDEPGCRNHPASADLRDYLAKIVEGAHRCRTITKNLLVFARKESSAVLPLSAADVVESTLDLLGTQLRHSHVSTSVRVAAGLPKILGNANQLQQVLTNLVMNAIHAMPKGGEVTLCCDRDGEGGVCISVADTGVGIAPEILPRIFEPFFTTRPVGKGTGLGLSLSWGIVQTHGGRIEVESQVGAGATFRVYLPPMLDTPLADSYFAGSPPGSRGRTAGIG